MNQTPTIRIGVDVGGTFTDLVALDERDGTRRSLKVLSDPEHPASSVLRGLRALAEQGVRPEQVKDVVHGTTLVANAVIQRHGCRLALLTTRGFRDTLEFANRELRYDIYDPNLQFAPPPVPREMVFEIDERMTAAGTVHRPLDRAQAMEVIGRLAERNVEAVAISLIHSYLAPDHELLLRSWLEDAIPGVAVSLSHEVFPEVREYERACATAINAYVQPLVREYIGALKQGLREAGISGPLYLMTSSGGVCSPEEAERFPSRLIQSGQAAGAVMAARVLPGPAPSGLAFDMGGTTAKACVIRDGAPSVGKSQEVARLRRSKQGSGIPLRIPMVDLIEIGAGGGSIAWVNQLGLLTVGPESAGASPGPACYGLGGTRPTVTDAHVVLGLIDPASSLSDRLPLDRDAAAAAIDRDVASVLGLKVEDAAAAIIELVTDNMAEAARVHAVEKNVDVRRLPLVAFGGAGPLHAWGIARRLQSPAVIVPPRAGVLSAEGMIASPIMFELQRAVNWTDDQLAAITLLELMDELEAEARAGVTRAGGGEPVFEHVAEMAYQGQNFYVPTPVGAGVRDGDAVANLRSTFDAAYETTYGRQIEGLPARCVNWRLVARAAVADHVNGTPHSDAETNVVLVPPVVRSVQFPESGVRECAIFDRDLLPRGWMHEGPVLIADGQCTIVVPMDARVHVDDRANVVLEAQIS